MKRIWRLVFIVFTVMPQFVFAQPDKLLKAVGTAKSGQVEKAYKELSETQDEIFTKDERHLKYFALGKWASELKMWKEAKEHLTRALELEDRNAAAIHFLLGDAYKQENNTSEALKHLNKVMDAEPAQNIAFEARFEFSELAMKEGKVDQAYKHLKYLERRWRGTPNYPEVVWRLIGVEKKRRRGHLACRWARKMFTRYAAHPLVADWGIELQKNNYEGEKLNCMSTAKDIRERIRKLQQSGYHERARAELEVLRPRMEGDYEFDLLMVSHLDLQGFSDEALALLLKYFAKKSNHVPYLNLLGRLGARAGEPHIAIYAYDAVARRTRGRHGRQALFYSGFLRYQIQDYDGAHLKFSEVMRKYKGSKQARDAKWYWAWMRYLKGNYAAAERAFRDLYNDKIHLRRRRVRYPFRDDRTEYWLAMSVLRQGRNQEARPLFEKIISRNETSYYSVLSRERLQTIPVEGERRLAADTPSTGEGGDPVEVVSSDSPRLLFSPNGEQENAAEEDAAAVLAEPAVIEESDEENGDSAAGGAEETAESGEKEENGETLAEGDPIVPVTAFRDPKLRKRFQRARDLILIGMDDWAKWELFEIERRTRNKSYLRTLMASYNSIGAYNRSAYIAEIYFSGERARAGMQGDRELWEYNYPLAFSPYVEKASAQFGVPDSLILSIMRAESHFNMQAISPVGARGLMQVMPHTANQVRRLSGESSLEQDELLRPEMNIRIGTRYLARLQKKFKGEIPLIAAGYNAGPHRVNAWLHDFGSLEMDEFIEHVPFIETRNYIKKVVRYAATYSELYGKNRAFLSSLTKQIPLRVDVRPSSRENWEPLD